MTDAVALVKFQQEQIARVLIDYLNHNGIQASYGRIEDEFPHAVFLQDADDVERAREIAAEFIENPFDRKYQQAAWQHGQHVDIASSTGSGVFASTFALLSTPVTATVLVIALLTFFASILGFFGTVRSVMQIMPVNELMQNGQWWRLITPAFIHFSGLHLVFNVVWWVYLGRQIEQRFGISTLLTIFLVTALISNVGQLMASGPYFGGLSGVVYGLLGVVWVVGWLRPGWGLHLPKPVIGFMLIWLLLGYTDVLWVNMANTAHTLGLMSGCALAWLLTRIKA